MGGVKAPPYVGIFERINLFPTMWFCCKGAYLCVYFVKRGGQNELIT